MPYSRKKTMINKKEIIWEEVISDTIESIDNDINELNGLVTELTRGVEVCNIFMEVVTDILDETNVIKKTDLREMMMDILDNRVIESEKKQKENQTSADELETIIIENSLYDEFDERGFPKNKA